MSAPRDTSTTSSYTPRSRIVRISEHLRNEWQLYVMLLPTIIWFIVFLYKPMYGLQIAFKDFSIFRGVADSPWVGLEHFQTLFGSDQFLRAVKNTVIISFLSLCFGFPMPIILALMFNEITHQLFKKTSQTIVYLPHFISTVIIAGIVMTAFSPSAGIVNTFLQWLGCGEIAAFVFYPRDTRCAGGPARRAGGQRQPIVRGAGHW